MIYTLKPTVIQTSRGSKVTVWRKEMPIIKNYLAQTVFYLFKDEESALNSEHAGGTGFFVHLKTEAGNDFFYAVTNRHVIEKGSAVVIRVNHLEGGFDTIPLTLCDWENHEGGADIAIARVEFDSKKHKVKAFPVNWFLRPEFFEGMEAIGSEIYILGRFIYHGGRTINMPSARTGIISLLPNPDERIPQEYLEPQEAFLCEMRSISGFSGSPVFLNQRMAEFNAHLKTMLELVYGIKQPEGKIAPDPGHWILGIDAGSFKLYEDVVERIEGNEYKKTNYRALSHSGFSVVIPGWKILETLDQDIFLMERKEKEKKSKHKEGVMSMDFAEDEKHIFTQFEFEEALKKTSRKTSEPVSEKKQTSE